MNARRPRYDPPQVFPEVTEKLIAECMVVYPGLDRETTILFLELYCGIGAREQCCG
jgi:hypothetical protein